MSLIGVFHRYTYIFHGYSGISVVFRYFGDSCDWHFSYPEIPTHERIIIWAVLGFEEKECLFLLIIIIIILPYMGMTVNGAWPFEQTLKQV